MHTEFCFFQHLTLTVHIALKGNSILLLSEHPPNKRSLKHLLGYCNIKHKSEDESSMKKTFFLITILNCYKRITPELFPLSSIFNLFLCQTFIKMFYVIFTLQIICAFFLLILARRIIRKFNLLREENRKLIESINKREDF